MFFSVKTFFKLLKYSWFSNLWIIIITGYHIYVIIDFTKDNEFMIKLVKNSQDFILSFLYVLIDIILILFSTISMFLKGRLLDRKLLSIKSNFTFKFSIFCQFLLCIIYCFFCLFSLIMMDWKSVESFEEKMKSAMAIYPDGNYKPSVDRIQMKYKCCGIRSYEDWFQYNWYGKKLLKTDLINDDIPFSCCSDDIVVPCIHHGLKSKVYYNQYNFEKLAIWREGCSKKYLEVYKSQLLYLYTKSLMIPILYIIQNFIDRFLQTADSTACINYQCEGWICRRN